MNVLPARRDVIAGSTGMRASRALARPGIAVAASAPVALVVLSVLPSYRPHALLPLAIALLAAAVLVLATEVACVEPAQASATSSGTRRARGPDQAAHPSSGPRRRAGPGQWSDPAMVGVDRWLAQWPGIAGVSAASWWAARAGAAGLLCAMGFQALGLPSAKAAAAGVAAVMAVGSLLAASRHLVHLALGLVAATGLLVTVSGIVAAFKGQLGSSLLPRGPALPPSGPLGVAVAQVATTVALLALVAVCLPSLSAATCGASSKLRWLSRGVVGVGVATWAFTVPALLRASGLSLSSVAVDGRTGSVVVGVANVLWPVSGTGSLTVARAVVCASCLAAAFGAMAGGTGLAETALGSARAARASAHKALLAVPGAGQRQAPSRTVPLSLLAGVAAASALAAASAAAVGVQAWLAIGLGSLATGALALTSLAPPVLRRCQRLPRPVRIWVGATWAVVATVAIGSAGPRTLALDGLTALAGAFALGWRGGDVGGLRTRNLALPWSTAAAALVTTSAVTALEVVPLGAGTSGDTVWKGLAVVATGAGIVVLAVFPATSRLRADHLSRASAALADRALPALAVAFEELARGGPGLVPTSEISELKAATRPLENEVNSYRGSDAMLDAARALVEASRQVVRLANGLDAVSRLDGQRLEELVEERTSAISSVNRHLVDSQWRRRQLLDRTVRVAEGERARIAANLHDGPIQRLAALGLVLDRCRLRLDRDDSSGARDLIKRARSELSEEIEQLRQMMSELRPPILDEGGLEAAIADHVSAWCAATGSEANFEASPHPSLSPNNETVVYRVVQEALANVAKHAKASLATVRLEALANGVKVVVRDNGRGFSTLAQPDLLRNGHFGLVVMRERVELASGRFEVKSAPLTGTEVSIWLPASSTNEPVEAA